MQESDPWACLLGLWLLLGNHRLPGALEQFLPRILSPLCWGSGATHPKPACKLLYSRRTIDLCVLQPRCFDKAKPQIWKTNLKLETLFWLTAGDCLSQCWGSGASCFPKQNRLEVTRLCGGIPEQAEQYWQEDSNSLWCCLFPCKG